MAESPAGEVDYETPDGSQFSLREIWSSVKDEPSFQYTSTSAYVDGVAYTGKLPQRCDEIDDVDVLSALEPVPIGCVHPLFPEGFTQFDVSPNLDRSEYYFKAPSFTYDDCRPGRTFVADCMLNEVSVLERLKVNPHPNLPTYHGCVVKDGHITHICLTRYPYRLDDYISNGVSELQSECILQGLRAAITHLHSLGLAHNDVNPGNVCVDDHGQPILIDFDGCLPSGKPLMKGVDVPSKSDSGPPLSTAINDFHGLAQVERMLFPERQPHSALPPYGDDPKKTA